MGILLDRGVAIGATEAAVNAGVEGIRIDTNAVTSRVLHGLVGMAREAVGLRAKS